MKRKSTSKEKTVMVRDLMKSIFVFGFRDGPIEFTCERGEALRRFSADEAFYVYPGGDTLFRVDPAFYRSVGIPRLEVIERLTSLFPSAPEAVGL